MLLFISFSCDGPVVSFFSLQAAETGDERQWILCATNNDICRSLHPSPYLAHIHPFLLLALLSCLQSPVTASEAANSSCGETEVSDAISHSVPELA